MGRPDAYRGMAPLTWRTPSCAGLWGRLVGRHGPLWEEGEEHPSLRGLARAAELTQGDGGVLISVQVNESLFAERGTGESGDPVLDMLVHSGRISSQAPALILSLVHRHGAQISAGTPSARQDDPWEAPAECDSARRENEGMRTHFKGKERSGGVRAQASHVVRLTDRGCRLTLRHPRALAQVWPEVEALLEVDGI